MQHQPEPSRPDVQQDEIGTGTPPSRVPETLPDTDIQPEQQPVRDTPAVQSPGAEPP